jgi:hypothetical protein
MHEYLLVIAYRWQSPQSIEFDMKTKLSLKSISLMTENASVQAISPDNCIKI